MDAHVAAHVMAPAFGVEDQVIVLVRQIHVGFLGFRRRRAGVLAAPPGVEAELVLAHSVYFVVVDIVVEGPHVGIGLVLYLDTSALTERHGEIAVHRRPLGLPGVGGHVQHRALVRVHHSVSHPEEVAHRRFHAWVFHVVPIHADHQLAQIQRVLTCDREPDVPDDASALDQSDILRLALLNQDRVSVSARTIPT